MQWDVLWKPWPGTKTSNQTIRQDQRINGGVQRMVTHKRGTVACLFTAAVLIAFTTLGFAQSNESGYTSKYLANNKSKLSKNLDNAKARSEAMKERFGLEKRDAKAIFAAAKKEQQKNANLLPGGHAPAGAPTWVPLGPTRTNHIQNGITLNSVNS